MRKFAITVNERTYEVEVEEIGQATGVPVSAPSVRDAGTSAPNPIPVENPVEASEKNEDKKATVSEPVPQGAETVKAPMPGTILDIKVKAGDEIKKGDVLAILEAMKMENEIMSPRDAKVISVQVTSGTSVNAGDALVALQ